MSSESREGTGNRHTFLANDYSIRLAPTAGGYCCTKRHSYFRGGPLQARYTWMVDSGDRRRITTTPSNGVEDPAAIRAHVRNRRIEFSSFRPLGPVVLVRILH